MFKKHSDAHSDGLLKLTAPRNRYFDDSFFVPLSKFYPLETQMRADHKSNETSEIRNLNPFISIFHSISYC